MKDTPFNDELERRLLSCLMFGVYEVQCAQADGLTPEAFYFARNGTLFRCLSISAADSGQTDAPAVWRVASGLSDEKPNFADISAIEILEPTSLRRKSLTEDVLALWKQRGLIAHLSAAKEEAVKNGQNWADIWERVQPHVTLAGSTALTDSARSVESMKAAAKVMINDPGLGCVAGPFPSWDRQSKPLRAGQMVVLAGRPGTGKTALALQYLRAPLQDGLHAAIFSLEMSGDELLHRAAHQIAKSYDQRDLNAAIDGMDTSRLHIYEARDHATLAQIESRTKLLNSAHKLGIVIIDYLGLVRPPQSAARENREQQVALMSRTFKLLAGTLPCPLMVLHQLNRESEKDQRRPRLSDLRESGAIEQDADAVWLLWENLENKSPDDVNAEVHLIQAKRRNGQPNIFTKLRFNRPTLTFTPITNERS